MNSKSYNHKWSFSEVRASNKEQTVIMCSVIQEKDKTERIPVRNDEIFNYLLNVTRSLLKIIGAWPLEADASSFEKFIKYLINLVCCLMILFFLIPSILYIVFVPQSIRVKLKIAATVFTCAVNSMKYTLLLKQSKQLRICFYNAKEDWQMVRLDEDFESMLTRGKLGRTLAILSTGLIYGGTIFYRTVMPFTRGKIVVNNVTIRPLACPSYYIIFDEQKSPAYELVFLGHFLSGFIVYTISSAVCALTTFFVLHICGQLEVLIRKLKNIETVKSDDVEVKELIADIVLHQIKIRRQFIILSDRVMGVLIKFPIYSFIKEVVEIVQFMVFTELASCMAIICIVLHSFIMDYNIATSVVTYSVIIASFTYNLFIFCYIGELLADQKMKVITTSSTLDWHHLSAKSARSLILIILMSNTTPQLTAGKILELSLSNFTSLVKTTIGYFNILRSMTY